MRDRESTRLEIDRAMEAIYEILGALSDWKVQILALQRVIDDPTKTDEAERWMRIVAESLLGIKSTIADLGFSSVRLRFRPDTGQLSDAYRHARQGINEFQSALSVGAARKLTDEELKGIEELDSVASEKVGGALRAWRSWLED